MKCQKCGFADSKVIESRDIAEGTSIRRRRQCLKCSHRFTTYERMEVPVLNVIKKDGSHELFERAKLRAGIERAVEKRPVKPVQVEAMVADIERQIFERGKDEVSSQDLGELVMEHLRQVDDVAYVRFASVYRSFTSVDSFTKELAKLKGSSHARK